MNFHLDSFTLLILRKPGHFSIDKTLILLGFHFYHKEMESADFRKISRATGKSIF